MKIFAPSKTRFHLTTLLAVVAGCVCSVSTASAGGWMYRPSYYSHDLPPEVAATLPQPVARSAYRPTYTGANPGASVRTTYRLDRSYLRVGSGVDLNWYYETSVDFIR